MVKIELEDGSRRAVQVDGGGTGRSILLRVLGHEATPDKVMLTLSLSPSESEALENALRIQRRVAERRNK